MFNIPNIPSYIQAPWEEEEWHCPECGGHMDDVDCEPWNELCQEWDEICHEEWCFGCENHKDDCECEGEE